METDQSCTVMPRELTEEERRKLAQDTKTIPEFKQQKLEKEAQKNWDIFYKRNTTKFFKDRHWTTQEFTELTAAKFEENEKLTVLEVGCGVGNFIFPLLEELPNIYFHACDFSPRAVQFVKEHHSFDPDRCHVFQNDLTRDALSEHIDLDSVDIVTMIFVLSAIHPDKMINVLCNIHTVLKPGGYVLIRDYGLYDHAMLRFSPGHKISDNFYVRQDGTRAYYFSTEKLSDLFHKAGFVQASLQYVHRETVNRKEDLHAPRVFVQGKFIKRASHDDLKCSVDSDKIDETNKDTQVNSRVCDDEHSSAQEGSSVHG